MPIVKYYPSDDDAVLTPFIKELSKENSKQAKQDYYAMRRFIDMLKDFGLSMKTEFKRDSCEKVEDNLYELRPRGVRVLFTIDQNGIYWLLQGFKKKTNKTPDNEKVKAREYIKIIRK